MSRIWLVAWHHLYQEGSKRSFLLVLFSLPLFLTVTIGMSLLLARAREEQVTIGYVDPGGFLAGATLPDAGEDVAILPFTTDELARAALDDGRIASYYLLPASYPENQDVSLVFFERPAWRAHRAFTEMLRRQHLAGRDPALVTRALEGPQVLVRTAGTGRDVGANGPRSSDAIPLVIAAFFGFLVMTTSGYMMEAVATEKENRTMEILITSLSPGKMMLGKILGAIAIAALQLLVWVTFLLGALWVGAELLEVSWIQELELNRRDLLQMTVVAIPVYLCISALFTAVGATLSETHEAQQIGPLFLVILYVPIWILIPLAGNLNGTLPLLLSFFPPTALTAVAARMIFIAIPWWQIGVSAALALAGTAGMIWLAGKALRLNMLRYGQPLRLRQLLRHREAPLQPRGSS